jgi:hypothetical protein
VAERVECELAVVDSAGGPAHDPSRKQVEQHGQVQPTFAGRDVRHVACPCRVGGLRVEVALEQVGRDGMLVARVGRMHEAALLPSLQAVFAHQALDALLAHANAAST